MSGRPDYDVGDLVVCVDLGDVRWPSSGLMGEGNPNSKLLKLGSVYRVDAFVTDKDGDLRVVLHETKSCDETGGFHPARFRKVDPLPDALTSLLASKPVRESIPA